MSGLHSGQANRKWRFSGAENLSEGELIKAGLRDANPVAYSYTNDFNVEAQRGEFVETGIRLFDSEDMTDTLLRLYLGLSVNGWNGGHMGAMTIDNIGELYVRGLWLPCVPRVALAGVLDIRNDGLPDYGAIPLERDGGGESRFDFIVAQKLAKLPPGWRAVPGAQALIHAAVAYGAPATRADRRTLGAEVLNWQGWYLSLHGDRLVPARSQRPPNGGPVGLLARYSSAALQVVSDFRHLWTVETEESPIGGKMPKTPLRLGVNGDIIKSLFYAREAPRTESGRRRPILHWVRQHQRRIADGVDVDVRKHMRGVTEFEMDGFPFRITSPLKRHP
jgi:hypothetical protein